MNTLRVLLFVLAGLAAATPSAGELTCSTADVIAALRRGERVEAGDARCRSDGAGEIVRQDVLDGLTVRSSNAGRDTVGDILEALGRPRAAPLLTSPQPRPSFAGAPDGAGGLVLRDERGAIYTPPMDPQGNSTFYTDDGRIMRCHTSAAGVTTCD